MSVLDPEDRLGYKSDLESALREVATYFDIGQPTQMEHLAEGYEDCNVQIETASGKYVCKLFADNQLGDYSKTRRGQEVSERLVEIILAVQSNGANAPKLVKGKNGHLYRNGEIVAICYEWIEGKSYFDLNRAPNEAELRHIIQQAALINTTDLHPVNYHDIWAVPHIHALADKVRKYLSTEDLKLITEVLEKFDRLKTDTLPKCLVHGDLTKGNVLLSKNNTPFIIDFSVTNWTTRIIELVLIVCNLMYDESDTRNLKEKAKLVSDIYLEYSSLTPEEIEALPDLSLAGSAMEFLGGLWRQKFLEDNSEETEYWLSLGRKTLMRDLNS